ncbi:GNAT family N-acetyltransferase [Lysobacter solisilvae (ex Woo and Kim 2020)]|uniref:GNAT family N-acetyltransferase n=1 Tax=Agrilutibacter terrestris TaxID=2865112 RepID=A0A7H0FWV3_9GAMM|nr:GNAT family N-acetyltransferase [Lysobacter terrestris]QNP40519.1 GNAT family N-acetyltransferase [Lysobacter terrestris]
MDIARSPVDIAPLREIDLPQADRIFRLAFGTFIGLPEPLAFGGDSDYVCTRWRAAPDAALGAYIDGTLVGSNFATRWGSFGFFGPLTVHPEHWDKGIARRLLAETMALFDQWGVPHVALFTFPHSTKHVGLYQSHGFWPQQLTPVMAKAVASTADAGSWQRYSVLDDASRSAALAACRALADAVHPGLDPTSEIESARSQRIGDTALVYDGTELVAFAVCHLGKGSEAGSGSAYVKFGAARPGAHAAAHFERLLSASEALAHANGMEKLVAGVNTSRHDAYRRMLDRGFRTMMQGVAMQLDNAPGYNRADCFVIDDWR